MNQSLGNPRVCCGISKNEISFHSLAGREMKIHIQNKLKTFQDAFDDVSCDSRTCR